MKRMTALFCVCLLLTGVCTGCKEAPVDSSGTTAPETTEPVTLSRNLCYITDSETTDAAQLSEFRAQLTEDGYTWTEGGFADLTADVDAAVLHAPSADLTKEEMDALNLYMSSGGHLLLFLPANEAETRYKYLAQFLEPYCMSVDYDRIYETDNSRTQNGDKYDVQTNFIARPDDMPLYNEALEGGAAYFNDARSFHFVYQDHFSTVKQDVMLQTAATAVGEPCGGTEDDPLTYEGKTLNVMGYARSESNANSAIVFVGAANFLENGNYSTENTAAAWVHSALEWFIQF